MRQEMLLAVDVLLNIAFNASLSSFVVALAIPVA
jgi:hypothetical protein